MANTCKKKKHKESFIFTRILRLVPNTVSGIKAKRLKRAAFISLMPVVSLFSRTKPNTILKGTDVENKNMNIHIEMATARGFYLNREKISVASFF